jgi:hypothetical protein
LPVPNDWFQQNHHTVKKQKTQYRSYNFADLPPNCIFRIIEGSGSIKERSDQDDKRLTKEQRQREGHAMQSEKNQAISDFAVVSAPLSKEGKRWY